MSNFSAQAWPELTERISQIIPREQFLLLGTGIGPLQRLQQTNLLPSGPLQTNLDFSQYFAKMKWQPTTNSSAPLLFMPRLPQFSLYDYQVTTDGGKRRILLCEHPAQWQKILQVDVKDPLTLLPELLKKFDVIIINLLFTQNFAGGLLVFADSAHCTAVTKTAPVEGDWPAYGLSLDRTAQTILTQLAQTAPPQTNPLPKGISLSQFTFNLKDYPTYLAVIAELALPLCWQLPDFHFAVQQSGIVTDLPIELPVSWQQGSFVAIGGGVESWL
jgi:hypothetical protein